MVEMLKMTRQSQATWARRSLKDRSSCAKRFAQLVAERSLALHQSITTPQRRDYRETLSAELLPLVAAAKWLSKNATSTLKPRRLSRFGAPLWIGNTGSRVERVPFGVVLILGTWNYPWFLVGVQVLQALVAGNAVVIKPAVGCERLSELMRGLLIEAGVPSELVQVVDASNETAQALITEGIDKLVMTGSSRGGRAVLHSLAEKLTPSVMELSGCDAMFLLPDFDIRRVVDCLVFSLRMNGGATCLAPRRVFVPSDRVADLEERLKSSIGEIPPTTINPSTRQLVSDLLKQHEVRCLEAMKEHDSKPQSAFEKWESGRVLILCDITPDFPLAKADIFAPLVMLMPYKCIDAAVLENAACPYALTASVFGSEAEAQVLSQRIKAGVIVINDVIVPTADPRLPFGGVGESGFGVTRGPEGLLEMTFPKVVAARRGNRLLHLEPPREEDERILEGLLQFLYCGNWKARIAGLRKLIGAANSTDKKKR